MTPSNKLTCETGHVDVLAETKRLQRREVAIILFAARIAVFLRQSVQVAIV